MAVSQTRASRDALPYGGRSRAMSPVVRHNLIRIALVVSFLAIWEFVPADRGTLFWMSRPSLIAGVLYKWIATGELWEHLGATLSVMSIGYALGCIIGAVTGFTLALVPKVQRAMAPYLSALYSLPKIALVPLFIMLFGIGLVSKIALVVITVFFIVLYNTMNGVQDVHRDMIQAVRLMGGTRIEIICKLLLPAALPWVLTGMRISVRYAFTNTLLAELLGANRGIGFLIEYNSGLFNATGVYAGIVVLVVFSVLLTEVIQVLQRATAHHSEK